ncbi:MAG: hypothetical protein WCJ85_08960 [Chitinophagaceae bacterium]
MKRYLPFIALFFLLAGCKSSKNYLARADEDRTLFDVVKRLNKSATDADALAALPVLYPQAATRHLKIIESYSALRDISRWDKILNSYNTLQNMHDAIVNSSPAFRLVNPHSYLYQIDSCKQLAAEDYYLKGSEFLLYTGRDNAKKSYNFFKKASQFVINYKESSAKMEQAYNLAVVNVIINPIQDNSYFNNSGWGNTGYSYSNDYFQQNLIRDLGGYRSNRYPARFYTEWEARRENVKPDWLIDLTLRNLDIPRPSIYSYTKNLNKKVENGKDSSGNKIYQTVYATLTVNRESFNARGQMDLNIQDLISRKNITYNSYREDYSWQEESATFTGDSRALSSSDWNLVNNRRYNVPAKQDILNELYRKIYPQVKNRIVYMADW